MHAGTPGERSRPELTTTCSSASIAVTVARLPATPVVASVICRMHALGAIHPAPAGSQLNAAAYTVTHIYVYTWEGMASTAAARGSADGLSPFLGKGPGNPPGRPPRACGALWATRSHMHALLRGPRAARSSKHHPWQAPRVSRCWRAPVPVGVIAPPGVVMHL